MQPTLGTLTQFSNLRGWQRSTTQACIVFLYDTRYPVGAAIASGNIGARVELRDMRRQGVDEWQIQITGLGDHVEPLILREALHDNDPIDDLAGITPGETAIGAADD